MLAIQTCIFWIYSDQWGYSNDGIAMWIRQKYKTRWGELPLDFLFGLPGFDRPLRDPLMDVSLRTVFEANAAGPSGNSGQVEHITCTARSKSFKAYSYGDTPAQSEAEESESEMPDEEDYLIDRNNNNTDGIEDEDVFDNSTVDWFYRQSTTQKMVRTIIAICGGIGYICVIYNAIYFFKFGANAEKHTWNQISNFESIGPLGLFVWFWLMVSSWYAGNTVMTNSNLHLLTNAKERQSMGITYSAARSRTNVDILLRSYSFYQSEKSRGTCCERFQRFRQCKNGELWGLIGMMFFSLVIAMTPVVARAVQKDKTAIPGPGDDCDLTNCDDELISARNTALRAIIVNFVLMLLIEIMAESIVRNAFENYKTLMTEITKLIEIPNHQQAKEYSKNKNKNKNKNKEKRKISKEKSNINSWIGNKGKSTVELDGVKTKQSQSNSTPSLHESVKTGIKLNDIDGQKARKTQNGGVGNVTTPSMMSVSQVSNTITSPNKSAMDLYDVTKRSREVPWEEHVEEKTQIAKSRTKSNADVRNGTKFQKFQKLQTRAHSVKIQSKQRNFKSSKADKRIQSQNKTYAKLELERMRDKSNGTYIDDDNGDNEDTLSNNQTSIDLCNATDAEISRTIDHLSEKKDDFSIVYDNEPDLYNNNLENVENVENLPISMDKFYRQTSVGEIIDGGLAGDDYYDISDGNNGESIFGNAGLEFLCLDSPENLISWNEIRDYAYVMGRQTLGELEWFMFFVGFVIVSQAAYVFCALWLSDGVTGQTVFANYTLFFLVLAWSFRVMWYGRKFDQLQERQVKALINQSTCIRSEIITNTTFTGPPKWIELKVGTWQRLYDLAHAHARKDLNGYERIGMNDNNTDNNNNNNNNNNSFDYTDDENDIDEYYGKNEEMKESEKQVKSELKKLEKSFDQYLRLLDLFTQQVELNKIHPKIFGMKLSGALMKAIAASILGFVIGIIKVLFF